MKHGRHSEAIPAEGQGTKCVMLRIAARIVKRGTMLVGVHGLKMAKSRLNPAIFLARSCAETGGGCPPRCAALLWNHYLNCDRRGCGVSQRSRCSGDW